MAEIIGSGEIVTALLLVKAVLAVLAALLFLYYKFYWEKAKRHLPIHLFYTKWRAVRHAVALGAAAIGFAIGFTLEIFGFALGLSPGIVRGASSLFEIGSLFAILLVFFQLALEDVPHFSNIAEQAHHAHHAAEAKKSLPRAEAKVKGKKKKR